MKIAAKTVFTAPVTSCEGGNVVPVFTNGRFGGILNKLLFGSEIMDIFVNTSCTCDLCLFYVEPSKLIFEAGDKKVSCSSVRFALNRAPGGLHNTGKGPKEFNFG